MNIALKSLTFLIPSVGIVGGLSLAPMISVFMVFFLLAVKSYSTLLNNEENEFQVPRLLGYVFFIWCGISILWSEEPRGNLILISKLFILFTLCSAICCSNLSLKTISDIRKIIVKPLLWGMLAAVIIFIIEYFTNGSITLAFRSIFQSTKDHLFGLHMLDRGCAFLSLMSWIAIGWLIQNNKKPAAFLIYCIILYLLAISDSLASFVSFILGGIAFLLVLLSRKFIWFIMVCMLMTSALLPVAFYKMNPHEVSRQFEQLPLSAKHRLFIWHFVAEKIYLKPVLGYGFNSSKDIATDKDITLYNHNEFFPLPLHPHNNIMQVLLETGIIGLILFTAFSCSILTKIAKRYHEAAASTACFVSYFSIGMISFAVWQTWWVASGLFAALMVTILFNKIKTT